MLRDFCLKVCNNKNLLMLVSVGIYILALFATLSANSILFSFLLTIVLVLGVLKGYFPLKYILIWALIFYFGVMNTSVRLKNTDELLNLAPLNSTITGKIISIPQIKDDKTKFFFDVSSIKYNQEIKTFKDEKILVTLNSKENLKRFDNYEIIGRLSTPFKAGNPSQFDYGDYLRNYNTYAVFYGKEFKKLDTDLTKIEKCLQNINDYRIKVINLHSRYLKSPNLEILGGIVFGDDAISPPQDIKESFINSGLLHILAASGMNVAFIFTFFFLIMSVLKINYRVNITIGIFTVLIYTLMTGLGASVVRAALMLIFVLIGKLIDRDAHSISLLSFVAFLMLVYNPMLINDVGFQLSFIVTLGLLLMTPYIVKSKYKIINWILGAIFVPIIAQLWVIPIQIFYFNNISLYSVFANIMSVPLLSVISFGGFISSLSPVIAPFADIICHSFDIVLNPLITLLVNISDFWGQLPNSTIQTTHPNIFQILIYYLVLLSLTAFLNEEIRKKYLKQIKIMLSVLILIIALSFINISNKNLEIMAFDLGNADAFLIKMPNNQYTLIDTGKSGYNGGKSQAEIIILKYFKDRGIKKLENLIITHFDNDHCGGALDILKSIKVENVYVNSLNHNSISAKEIYNIANEKNINLLKGYNTQKLIDRDIKLINYIAEDSLEKDDNEASIITLLEYGEFKMLFMGDAGIKTFEKLKKMLPKNITVLKVGHHGADGVVNNEMLESLNPKISLISVGQNKFGHPSIKTLGLLKDTKILSTEKNNAIKIVVNKHNYNVFVFSKKYRKFVSVKI